MKLETKLKDVNYRAKVVKLETLNDHPDADRLKVAVVDFQNIVVGSGTQVGDLYIFVPAEASINRDLLAFNNQFSKSCGLNVSQKYITIKDKPKLEDIIVWGNISPEEFIKLNGKKCIEMDKGVDYIVDGKYTIGGKFGFFEKYGRVKALKLRGVISEGYLMPISFANDWLESKGVSFRISEENVGEVFDSIGDEVFCKKYVNPNTNYKMIQVVNKDQSVKSFLYKFDMPIDEFNSINETSYTEKDKLEPRGYLVKKGNVKGRDKTVKRESRLVDNQFRLHVDTENLKRNMDKINPDDMITISEKHHGTSVVISRPLVKKKLNFLAKTLKKFGFDIVDTKYDLVYASRKVIKNQYADQVTQDFYDTDIWGLHANEIADKVLEGHTVYGEIVGHTSTGSSVQGGYDYGCSPKESKLFVYRMTYTTPQGRVIELSHPQVQNYCEKYGLEMPETHYHGYARDYKSDVKYVSEERNVFDWRKFFLLTLQEDFNEMDCHLCKNKVPREGIILRKESDTFEAFKLKSNRFLEGETKSLDKGESNMEDEG